MTEIQIEYYENGQVKSEILFENGKRHGVVKYYYENGNVMYKITNGA